VWKISKDAVHLGRVAVVFAVALVLFALLRQAVVPAGFGKYGHFRAGALDDNRNHALVYAGQQVCLPCHEPAATARSLGTHVGVACEACHGPLFRHSEAPLDGKPQRPLVDTLCRRCHEADAARPKNFPQVDVASHMPGAACNVCHQPHSPRI
jgi:hypothetical protein